MHAEVAELNVPFGMYICTFNQMFGQALLQIFETFFGQKVTFMLFLSRNIRTKKRLHAEVAEPNVPFQMHCQDIWTNAAFCNKPIFGFLLDTYIS